jgi:hypothetical protein
MSTANPDSILDSVKKTLGFDPDYEAFDLDITLFINGAFGSLQMAGVGSDSGFSISDNTTLWSNYVSNATLLNLIKAYIFAFVRLSFDPPGTSFGIDALKNMAAQHIWQINVVAEQLNPPSDPFGDETTDTPVYKPMVVELEFASVITPDAMAGNVFYLTLTSDCTIDAPISGVDGQHITLELTANDHTVTWGNGWNFGDAGEPDLSSAGKTDIISAVFRLSATDWYAGYTPGF